MIAFSRFYPTTVLQNHPLAARDWHRKKRRLKLFRDGPNSLTNRFWHGRLCVLGHNILHIRRMKRDLPRPLPKSSSSVDRPAPFIQGIALCLGLRAIDSLDCEREHVAAGQPDNEVGDVTTARASPHALDLKSKVIPLRVGDHLVSTLENNCRVTLGM